MTSPRPSVDTTVLDEIARAMTNEVPPPLVLKRLEKRAEQLVHTDSPEFVWPARVGLASLAWDPARAVEIAERARLAVGANPRILSNIAVSLHTAGEIEAALRFARLAVEASPVYPFGVRNLVTSMVMLGRFTEAEEVLGEYLGRVGNEQAPELAKARAENQERLAGLAEAGVREEHLQQEFAQCWLVMQQMHVRSPQIVTRREEIPESGGTVFIVRVRFKGTLDMEMELDATLAHRLARLPHWDPSRLIFHFEYCADEDANATL